MHSFYVTQVVKYKWPIHHWYFIGAHFLEINFRQSIFVVILAPPDHAAENSEQHGCPYIIRIRSLWSFICHLFLSYLSTFYHILLPPIDTIGHMDLGLSCFIVDINDVYTDCPCEWHTCTIKQHHREYIGYMYFFFNSLRPSDAYMRRWTVSSFVQIMACRLDGAKPLTEPMLTYCQLDRKEQYSVKYQSKVEHFHQEKCVSKCHL